MTNLPMIRRLDAADRDFDVQLQTLLVFEPMAESAVDETVKRILTDVRQRGDQAVVEYSNRFDRLSVENFSQLVIDKPRLSAAVSRIDEAQKGALETAARRVRDYHQHQLAESWQYTDPDGTVLGQKITPVDRVGLYVPGGKASYPSSVLMNAIPAQVAGVREVVMVSPTPDGVVNDMVLAAAAIAGVERVFTIGGAQAIAALAYGTQSVPRVDKIVGPGNVFVATAKRQVFGQVAIDMLAGPSEILIICDGKTDPDWVAMDLCSQAEHDENAQAILISPDRDFLRAVEVSLEKLLPTLEREDMVRQSLQNRGALIQVADLQQAIEISNTAAPEHLELSVEDPEFLLPSVRHAGAIFLGRYTAEALGDYCAGPNHVLPTAGTARFSSPLGVYDFQKRSSIIHCSPETASELGKVASVLARSESLEAHARSAEYRIKKSR
ncbi:MAG: histidinol dehydrogenase [Cellvibrionaceae bacterium]